MRPTRALVAAIAAAMGLAGGAGVAGAVLTRTATVSQAPIATATLAPASAFAADCDAVLGIGQVSLTWAPTPSTFATGYEVWRRQGAGAWVLRATVTPRTAATHADSLGLLTGLLGTTFTYRLVAVRGGWSTATATEPSVAVSPLGIC